MDKKILIAVFHKKGKNDDNFEKLMTFFNEFDVFVPEVDFYGNKWRITKDHFLKEEYDSLFVICSDVRVVCGNVLDKIRLYGKDKSIGTYGFGTIGYCTFDWLKYDNVQLQKTVPFIEGYCFGVNRTLLKCLNLSNIYGYGLDVEMGYKAHANNLRCFVDNSVCIHHEYGKSYSDMDATEEYKQFLSSNRDIHDYLIKLNIPRPHYKTTTE